jgi:hypothetical protein
VNSKPQIEEVTCGNCNRVFPDTVGGTRRSCPECGSSKRRYNLDIREELHISDSVEGHSIRVFYRRNPAALTVVVLISIASPLLGLWLVGWPGVVAGVILGVVSLFLGPIATTKIKEIHRF